MKRFCIAFLNIYKPFDDYIGNDCIVFRLSAVMGKRGQDTLDQLLVSLDVLGIREVNVEESSYER